jgi:hypothetical protein
MCTVVKNSVAVAVLEGKKAGLLVEEVANALGSRAVGGVGGDEKESADRRSRGEHQGRGHPLLFEPIR